MTSHALVPATFSSRGARIAWILGFTALIAVSARIHLPMHPAPMSMQSWAVLTAGAALGAGRGALAAALYVAAGALGLPVFAGGAGGAAHLAGPTGGYLAAFPLAAAATGLAAERGWMRNPAWTFAVFVLGHAVILGLGGAWLARSTGVATAVAAGIAPFVPGAIAKSALGAAALWALARLVRRDGA